MPRPTLTDAERLNRIPTQERVALLAAVAARTDADDAMRQADRRFAEAVRAAVEAGASYRDIGILTGIPYASVHQLVLRVLGRAEAA